MDTAQANALQAILQHDDSSTDTQLIEYFIAELEISPVEACRAVLNRKFCSEKPKPEHEDSGDNRIQSVFTSSSIATSSTTTNHGAPL